jgi:hypothetical protein
VAAPDRDMVMVGVVEQDGESDIVLDTQFVKVGKGEKGGVGEEVTLPLVHWEALGEAILEGVAKTVRDS